LNGASKNWGTTFLTGGQSVKLVPLATPRHPIIQRELWKQSNKQMNPINHIYESNQMNPIKLMIPIQIKSNESNQSNL
jgi:hypothetical protein